MKNTVFIKAEEIANELEISKALAYKMVHDWNEKLREKGTWYASFYYEDWKGVRKKKMKRGFEIISEYPNTGIIDTLQKVRECADDRYSYANDYELIARLKDFADQTGICLLLVHHTRKQQADDKFEMISGTNGLLGAADGAFLLHKERRTSCEAVLDVSGRDQPDQSLHLNRNPETLLWELEEADMQVMAAPPDKVLEDVAAPVTAEQPDWSGTATELAAVLKTDLPPNKLTMKLGINASRLFNDYGTRFEKNRTHDGRTIMLHRGEREA